MLTPSQYKDRYESIPVPLADGTKAPVKVHNYRLRSSPNFYNAGVASTFVNTLKRRGFDTAVRVDTDKGTTYVDPRLTQHNDAIAKGKRDLMLSPGGLGRNDVRLDTRAVDWNKMALFAFAGKGSPEANQIILQLALAWNLTTDPQDYADSALGLDCNGFVGNYLWHVIRANPWTSLGVENSQLGPDSPIKTGFYDRFKNKVINRWEDLDTTKMYIMMRTGASNTVINQQEGINTAHITITEPGGRQDRPNGASNPFAVTVIESTAGAVSPGLTRSYYTCVRTITDKVFKLNREAMKMGHRDVNFMIAEIS
jgi:hypothetical protein